MNVPPSDAPASEPLRLAVFDCDGTLVDSERGISAAMNAAWRATGLRPPPAAAARAVIGLSLSNAIDRLAPDADAGIRARLADAYREIFHDPANQREEPLYPGAVAALDAIEAAGTLLGVATGKGHRGLKSVLDKHALGDRFVTKQTADRARGKPDPEMLYRAMAEAGATPQTTVMIGDTVYDIEMARNAGVAAIGVAWGYHAAGDLHQAGATVVLDEFSQLPAQVMAIIGQGN